MASTGRRASPRGSSLGAAPRRRRARARRRPRRRRRAGGVLGRVLSWTARLRRLGLRSPSPVERDLLGLGLFALGVFMAFVLYGGWNGGGAGHGLAVAFGWLLGRARVLAPFALCWAGGTLVLAGVLPNLRPLRGGLTCLFASLTLALAAGTFGVSSGPGSGHAQWTPAFLQAHGGVVGESVYQVAHRLVQDVGVHILVIFLLLGGVIMLTGASVAGTVAAGSAALGRALGGLRPLLHR